MGELNAWPGNAKQYRFAEDEVIACLNRKLDQPKSNPRGRWLHDLTEAQEYVILIGTRGPPSVTQFSHGEGTVLDLVITDWDFYRKSCT